MTDILRAVGIVSLVIAAIVLVLELAIMARRAWFFHRTRRHVEREWREFYEKQR